MKQPEHQDLIVRGAQGELAPEEQARLEELLAERPELRATFEEERALQQLLEALPPAPVSSNFTARVLDQIARETAPRPAGRLGNWFWRGWKPAMLGAAIALSAAFMFHQQQRRAERQELAESLSRFSEVATTLAAAAQRGTEQARPVAMLQDFEAIEQLAHMPQDQDMDLYFALHR